MQPAEISVIVPTYNEAENLPELVRRIRAALEGVAWEIIVVDDDSPDGTAEVARRLYPGESRLRCIQRIGRRGLASACIEGMLASSAPYLAVMDADLQHDPDALARMLAVLREGRADLVVGSRYAAGGSVGEWSPRRRAISRIATRLSDGLAHRPLSDPMSGFFALTRPAFGACVRRLSALGFKILLDIAASSDRSLRVVEIPIQFGLRRAGASKLSGNAVWEHVLLLLDKSIGRFVPARFVSFGLIGAAGAGVHFLVLGLLYRLLGLAFTTGQTCATLAALVFNFTINNLLTYAGQSLRGVAWLKGLASFAVVCGVGAVANVGIAAYLFNQRTSWQLSALAGVALSAVWNYAVSARYTWHATR
jgi:dolichol-phosphate mannosyltransferase